MTAPPPDERALDALVNILDAYIHTRTPQRYAGFPIPLLTADPDGHRPIVRAGGKVVSADRTLWTLVKTRHYLAHRTRERSPDS